MKASVVGAGFSGLCSAYFLCKAGYQVEVFEKDSKSGGLIRTIQTPHGHCEIAANGILNSVLFESLSRDIELDLCAAQRSARKRYIFRGHPRRWPLNFFESAILLWNYLTSRSRQPKKYESLESWGRRVLGSIPTRYLLEPAVQGIYAGGVQNLSATLVLKRFFHKNIKTKPQIKGLVAPRGGMENFFKCMERYLKNHKVIFHHDKKFESGLAQNNTVTILATGVRDAAELLKPVSEKAFKLLSSIELLSLVKATLFYPKVSKKIQGFGMLFPRGQSVRSLGVLFNDFIFPTSKTSESFILGGSLDPSVVDLSDEALLEAINQDRKLTLNGNINHEGSHIQRWKNTLPYYSLELESTLENFQDERNRLANQGVFLMGNYLGKLGLSQLLEEASQLPRFIEEACVNS